MPKPACLFHFHCGGHASKRKEHVLPAALGGRRASSRILCDACQSRFSELDAVLPRQLRNLITTLGVVGDHRGTPARTELIDPVSKERYLLDHDGIVNASQPVLLQKWLDENGNERRRYRFYGVKAEKEFLAELEAERGHPVEVFDRTTEPFVIARPLEGTSDVGNDRGLRAAARIALNFLAVDSPEHARAPGLEPVKRWLLGLIDGETADYAHFAAPLSAGAMPPLSVPYGHRVVLAFNDGRIRARVVLFDVYEMAIDLGCVDQHDVSRVVAFDVDPFSKGDGPNHFRCIPASMIALGPEDVAQRVAAENVEAVLAGIEARLNEIDATFRSRDVERVLDDLVTDLRATEGKDRAERYYAVNSGLQERNLQLGVNLVIGALRALADRIQREAEDSSVAGLLRELSEPCEDSAQAKEAAQLLARCLLMKIAAKIAHAPETPSVAELRELLDGQTGRDLARRVVASAMSSILR